MPPPRCESSVFAALPTEHGARGIWQTIPVTKLDSVFSLQNIAVVAVKGDKMRTRIGLIFSSEIAYFNALSMRQLCHLHAREREGRGALFKELSRRCQRTKKEGKAEMLLPPHENEISLL